ncbi:MAG: peptide deformylase, partial [Phycisphaerae bacterium]
AVAALVDRMFELMFARQGVGLAAPQVGVTARLFIGSPSFSEDDRHVYINPELVSVDGWQEGEEGCLSFPDIHCRISRYKEATIRAHGLDGDLFEETGVDLTARLFQHEGDHLEGRLLVDRMGKLAKMAARRQLRELEAQFT